MKTKKAKLYLLNRNLAKCKHCSMISIGEDYIARCGYKDNKADLIDDVKKCFYWTAEFHNWKKKYWRGVDLDMKPPKSDLERFLE